MRLLSILASFVAALAIVLLIFGCVKEKSALSNTGGLEDVKARTQTYKSEVEQLRLRLANLESQIASATERLTVLQNRENYKTEPTAFLTFDVAFTANTKEILKVLDEAGLKGTFFVIGELIENNASAQALLKEAAAKGHKIGIRSYKNSVSTMYESEEAYFEDLYRCKDLLKNILGTEPVLVRMPGGTGTADIKLSKNTKNDDTLEKILDRMTTEGFIVNDWSVNSLDTDYNTDLADAVTSSLNSSKKYLSTTYKTNIVLFSDEKRTYRMLPDIIEGLRTQGFAFSTLPSSIVIARQR